MTVTTGTLFNPTDLFGYLTISGQSLDRALLKSTTSARIELTTDLVSQVTMEFSDIDYQLLKRDVLRLRAPVDFEDFLMRIATINAGGENATGEKVTIIARPDVVRKLKQRTGTKKITGYPSDFVIQECQAVGAPYKVQRVGKSGSIARDVKEGTVKYLADEAPSSWTTFQRLAGEAKAICFEAKGVIYFGQPSWFLSTYVGTAMLCRYTKNVNDLYAVLSSPQCSQSLDGNGAKEVSFQLPLRRWAECVPGRIMQLEGVPYFSERYMISSVAYDITGREQFIDVSGVTAIDEENVYSEGTPYLDTKKATSIVTLALQQAGDRYEENISVNVLHNNPDAFDNAELVYWACGRLGVTVPNNYTDLKAFCISKAALIDVEAGIAKRGALLFDDTRSRVAISLGDGRVIEARDRTYGVCMVKTIPGAWTFASRIPGAVY